MVDAGAAASRLTALLGGHVDVIFSPYGGVKDYIAKGEMVPLAMDGENDLVVPDKNINVKTIKHQGFDAYVPFYYFVAFPKGTDQALIDSFNAAAKDIIEMIRITRARFTTCTSRNPPSCRAAMDWPSSAPMKKSFRESSLRMLPRTTDGAVS